MLRTLTSLLLPVLAFGEIIETQHIAKIEPLVDQKTWVVVDIDNTTFRAAQALGSSEWYDYELRQLEKKGKSHKEALKIMNNLWTALQNICPVQPMEKDFIPLLQSFQDKKIVVMAATLRHPEDAPATLKQLHSLGFDFTKTAPSKENFSLKLNEPILYDHGILYVNDFNTKGEAFLAFLQKIDKTPAKVVFVDDKFSNVKDMDLALTHEGIPGYSVHYTAYQFAPPIFFPDIAAFQYKFVNRIMSNEAALALMRNNLE